MWRSSHDAWMTRSFFGWWELMARHPDGLPISASREAQSLYAR
jgi:hypothetical protein